ncbi:hypothetical protein NEM91_03435 [Staphylococcus haemolyticus]|nr:hypothetical protein [Staphylococcus haemolyticus]MEB7320988.1 hypothetical protein [Staphylococcus haemolyticus]
MINLDRNSKGQFVKGKNIRDKTGKKYGRLTVLNLSKKRSGRKTYWNCICECGNTVEVRSDCLGTTLSCGCLKREQNRINLTANHSHKQSRTRLYHIWQNMKSRCYNQNNKRYENYGRKGIKVCEEWLDFNVFYQWSLKSGYNDTMTIERNDIEKGYYPENCCWIPFNEQANNRNRTIWVEWNSKKRNLKQWSKELGINYGTLNSRYNRSGMRPPELFYPVKR